jgi:hypothetical protein
MGFQVVRLLLLATMCLFWFWPHLFAFPARRAAIHWIAALAQAAEDMMDGYT